MPRFSCRSGRFAEASDGQEPQINLTPMIDVSFVVLIMFIVIAPLLESERVELAQKGGKSASLQGGSVAITITAENEILFNRQKVALNDLLLLLKEAHQRNPQETPCLFPDRRAPFGTYQAVKNSVEMAGFQDLQVALAP